MTRAPVALLALAACGRVSFDTLEVADATATPSVWTELDQSAMGGGVSKTPVGFTAGAARIAIDSTGRPWCAWNDDTSGNREVYLRRWDGAAWVGVGGSDVAGGISNDPDESLAGGLEIGANDRPCIAWRADEAAALRLRCWDGATWAGLASSENAIQTQGNPWWPSLAFDGVDPIITWEDYGGGMAGVYVRQHGQGAWIGLGTSATFPGLASGVFSSIDIAPTGEIWIVWQTQDQLSVQSTYWTGTTWSPITTHDASAARSRRADVDAGARPYVAWIDGADGASSVYLQAWDGTTWIELGGSASASGISSGQVATYAEIAAMADGSPVVAYAAGGDIHVVRWDGTAWIRPGDQDAAGGISRTGSANWPSIEIAADDTIFVAWDDDSSGTSQIYMRLLQP